MPYLICSHRHHLFQYKQVFKNILQKIMLLFHLSMKIYFDIPCVCVIPAHRCHTSTPATESTSHRCHGSTTIQEENSGNTQGKRHTKKSKETEGMVELCTETLLPCCLALLADLVQHLPARSAHVLHDTCPLYRLCGIMCSTVILSFVRSFDSFHVAFYLKTGTQEQH